MFHNPGIVLYFCSNNRAALYSVQDPVQFSYRIYVSRSLNANYDGCIDGTNCEETFQFSAGQRTVRVSVMSS